ncbi:MAG: tyrosine-type recombinase/integrase, partial [Planctomycetota bacterium]
MRTVPMTESFTASLVDERHFSPYTARCYAADLRQLIEFLTGRIGGETSEHAEREAFSRLEAHADHAGSTSGDGHVAANGAGTNGTGATDGSTVTGLIANADADLIRDFLEHLGIQQYSPATMARKIATLRSFFKWATRRGLTPSNPMTLIRTPRQQKRLPKAITVEQIERLLSAPPDHDILGRRDRAMLETLYSTGIRVSELVGLNMEDVDFENVALLIRGKGRKERLAPLTRHALAAIQRYVDLITADQRFAGFWERSRRGEQTGHAMFLNKHGQRLSSRSVRRKLDKYLREAGLDPA